MNAIVVPTDFSAPSENAANYAATLAQQLNATLVLFHSYMMPVTMAETPVLTVSAETLRDNADIGLKKAKEQLALSHPGVEILLESHFGDLEEELKRYCRENSPALIIAGKHEAHGVERWLFGSTSQSLIRKLPVPLIIVPDHYNTTGIQQIALAVDDNIADTAKGEAASFARRVGASLRFVHVVPDAADVKVPADEGLDIVVSEESNDGIEQYIHEKNIDLLLFVPHHHSLFEKLFFRTHTAGVVSKGWVPVMCLPEEDVE